MDVFFALSHGVHRGVLKKGKFEFIGYSETAVAFRRYFESESLICVINRDSLLKEWKIETDSNEIEFIWGHEEVKYKNNLVAQKIVIGGFRWNYTIPKSRTRRIYKSFRFIT